MTRFIRMRDRSDGELQTTISEALQAATDIAANTPNCPIQGNDFFWKICSGVDAYFEARRRKDEVAAYGEIPAPPSPTKTEVQGPHGQG